MDTIRGRLTVWYATALILSLAVFAVVLYFARRSATYQDLDKRIQSEADLTAGILAESYRARGTLVEQDTAGRPVLTADVGAVLEVVPDFLLVTSRDGRLLFASPDDEPSPGTAVERKPQPASNRANHTTLDEDTSTTVPETSGRLSIGVGAAREGRDSSSVRRARSARGRPRRDLR